MWPFHLHFKELLQEEGDGLMIGQGCLGPVRGSQRRPPGDRKAEPARSTRPGKSRADWKYILEAEAARLIMNRLEE